MIHIKETEIIPLLKNAQAEYSQKITEGDPKDAEMAERIEEHRPHSLGVHHPQAHTIGMLQTARFPR